MRRKLHHKCVLPPQSLLPSPHRGSKGNHGGQAHLRVNVLALGASRLCRSFPFLSLVVAGAVKKGMAVRGRCLALNLPGAPLMPSRLVLGSVAEGESAKGGQTRIGAWRDNADSPAGGRGLRLVSRCGAGVGAGFRKPLRAPVRRGCTRALARTLSPLWVPRPFRWRAEHLTDIGSVWQPGVANSRCAGVTGPAGATVAKAHWT